MFFLRVVYVREIKKNRTKFKTKRDMSKKVLRISTAKLTVWCTVLLMAVFCTIGMSFTPAEEGEIVEPNDSTAVVSRPRRSHYFESGTCSDTNHYEKDYAKTTVTTTGNGYATIQSTGGGGLVTSPSSYVDGTVLTTASTANSYKTIEWNCNHQETADGAVTATEAMHKREFKIQAYANDGYHFAGWSTSASESDIVSSANPFSYTQLIDDWNQNNGSHEAENEALTTPSYYAIFKQDVIVNLTFAVSANGSYTYKTSQMDAAQTVSSSTGNKTLTTSKAVTLTATPASGYKFFGWYVGSDAPANYIGHTTPLEYGFEADAMVYAKFIKSDAAIWTVKGTTNYYHDFSTAITAAASSSSKVVLPIANGTLYPSEAGSYTIPSDVTLLIPYDAGNTIKNASPSYTYVGKNYSNPTIYRTLTFDDGVILNVSGVVEVGAQNITAGGGTGGNGGRTLGTCGRLQLNNGSKINLNSGAKLYTWGYITGSGTIDALSGSEVREPFQFEFRGGSHVDAVKDEVLPLNQYYVQNIEAPITFHYNSKEILFTAAYAASTEKSTNVTFIGTGGLFILESDATLTKRYDGTTDRQIFDLEGTTSLQSITVSVSVYTMSSSSVVLPITNNMIINVHSGTTSILYATELLADAKVVIDEGATIKIRSDLFIYDRDEWVGKNCAKSGDLVPITYSPTKTTSRTAASMVDATLVINGTLEMYSGEGKTGYLYTTTGGANICSERNGKIILANGVGSKTTTKQNVGTAQTTQDIPVTPAQLHNADGSYTATAGSAAGTVFTYCCGTWLQQNGCGEPYNVTWKNGSTTIDTESFYACEDPVYSGATPTKDDDANFCYTFDGWSETDGGDLLTTLPRETATYYAHFTSEPTVASVTIGVTTTYHTTLADAFAKAKTGDNALITLLRDVSGVSTGLTYDPSSAYKCTLDLNDKKISGTIYTLLKINKAGATFTITDSGTKGEIVTAFSTGGKALRYCIYVAAGILKLENGKISINNTTAYNSSVGCAAVGIATNVNYKFIMEGGALEASGNYRAHGVYSYGTTEISGGTINATVSASNGAAYGVYSAANTTTVSGSPIITVNAYKNAYGGYAAGNTPNKDTGAFTNGTLNIESGTFNVTTTTYDGAYGAFATAASRVISSGDNAGTYFSYGTVNVSGGTFNVTAKRRSAHGVYVNRAYVQTKTRPNAVSSSCPAVAKIIGGTFIVKTNETNGQYTAEGVRSLGTTTISGGSFTITANTYNAMGVNALDGTTTIENTHSPNFTVRANTYGAYGVYAGSTPASKTGIPYNGNATVNGGTFDVALNNKASADNKNVYGVYAFSGRRTIQETDEDYDASSWYVGTYVSAGSITVNDGTFLVDGHTTIVGVGATSTSSYDATNLTYGEETISCPAISATASMIVNGGKFKVTGTSGVVACQKPSPTSILQINGGFYNINTNLSSQVVSPKKVLTLRETHELYPAPHGYRYTVGEGGIVTWKNGTTTLLTEDYLKGETPAYSGETPTKTEPAGYTYTHNGWTPTIEVMANADKTYTATFSQTENKYSVSVAAGAGGSVSPTSVSNIGCETASGDITATPNTGYQFSNWTLPEGVTAASEYSANSNPIHIHATAAGKTITANFTAKTYTVTLDNQSATTAGQASVTATYNAAMPSIEANLPEKTGYTFGGYFTETNGGGTKYYNADGTSATNWNIDAATTLYAQWTINQYTISFDSNGGSDVASITQDYNSSVTAPADPTKTGYTFAGWDPAVPGTMPAEDTECVAQWTINSHNLSWNWGGGETSSTTHTAAGSVAYNTELVYPADNTMTKANYVFNGWSTDAATMPDEDLTITAQWTPAVASVTVSGATTYYTTLKGAFDYAADKTEPTITVLDDITLAAKVTYTNTSKTTVTIDLNGHTISGAASQLIYLTSATNAGGEIVIKSSVTGGQIRNVLSSTRSRYCVYLYKGKLRLKSGTIYNENTSTGGSFAVYNAGRTFTMEGGQLEAKGKTSVYALYSTGTSNVSGGKLVVTETASGSAAGACVLNGTTTISGTTDVDVDGTSKVYGVLVSNRPSTSGSVYNGTLKVTGGTFTVDASGNTAYGVYSYAGTRAIDKSGNYACAGTATISGGEFNVTSAGTTAYGVFVTGAVSISSAKDADGNATYAAASATSKATITGGKFKVSGTSSVGAVNTSATTNALKISGGYYNINTNLVTYAVSPKKVLRLRSSHELYPEPHGYRYTVGEGGTVTWKNGETTLLIEDYLKGETPSYTGAPPFKDEDDKYTYTHDGWEPAVTEMNNSDAEYSATFSHAGKNYAVTLNRNNGTGGSTSVTMTYNSAEHTAITNPTRTGYSFAGWYYTASGGGTARRVILKDGNMVENISGYTGAGGVWIRTTATTLYARWSENTYDTKFTHNGNGSISFNGSVVASGSTAKVYYFSAKSLVATPNTGYHFTGWTKSGTNASKVTIADMSAASTTIKATAKNATVTAGFEPDEYAITYKDQGDADFSGVHGDGYPTTHTYGTATALVNPTKTGYTFGGWYDNADCTGTALTEIGATAYTADFTLYAKWTPTDYSIAYHSLEGASNSNPATYTLESEDITLVDPGNRDGYTFAGWYTNEGQSTPAETPAISTGSTGDKEFWAKWTVADIGNYVDIIDATNDGSNRTLTLNVSSWPNTGWPFTINDLSYTATEDRTAIRTLEIPYEGLVPGADFVIDVKKANGAPYSYHTYKIPEVVSTAELSTDKDHNLYVKGGTLAITDNVTVKNIYVGADAKLVINEGKTLTADTIFLRTTITSAAELLNNGSIASKTKLYYTRIIYDKSAYFPFGLPLSCEIEDITMSDGSSRPKYGSGWLLRWYDEASRAVNGGSANNWTSKEGEPKAFPTSIVGGRGYEMFSAANYYREFYFPIDHTALTANTSVSVSYTESGELTNRGWNILVSPFTATCERSIAPEDIAVCWMNANNEWGEQAIPSSIPPGKPFAYQAYSGLEEISFAGATFLAPRRRVAATEEQTRIQWIHLDIENAEGVGDQTSIYSHPTRYEEAYKTGIDVAKQSFEASRALIYSTHTYGEMAFAGVADSILEKGVALTIYSPSEQTLSISMRENDWLNRLMYVWLIDNETGSRTDLMMNDYRFKATEGTTSGRFILQGVFAPKVTTDLQNDGMMNDEMMKARKLLIDDKIYIEVNGRLYDATGKLVNGK